LGVYLAETAAEKSLVVWINEHFGEIERDGKTFDQMQVFLENREKSSHPSAFLKGHWTYTAPTFGTCGSGS
jgi:hypothetical protein